MDTEKKIFSEFPPVSRQEWERVIQNDLGGKDYKSKLKWDTQEGIDALPFYRSDDFEELPAPIAAKRDDWEIRQPIEEADVKKANQIAINAIKNGADALEFYVNIQSTEGALSSDLQGTAIQFQEDFSRLVQGIDLTKTAIHFDSGVASPVFLAMLHNEIEDQNLQQGAISGSALYDPYALSITLGRQPNDKATIIERSKQLVEFCDYYLPHVKSLGVDARIYHNSGATIVQQLGYAIATGSEYLATLTNAGLDAETIASAIHFNYSIGSSYFLEVAKFRAARTLWRQILDAFEVEQEDKTCIHAFSSDWNKTVYEPYVNMLRTTTEGMAAAIAGCNSITLYPFDETFGQPDNFSCRIARNTQLIFKEEAYLNKVADPAAGSYYIEKLTGKIAQAAWVCFQEVEKQGGMFQSIKGGYPQTAIEESRNMRDRSITERERIFIGINQYPNVQNGKSEEQKAGKTTVALKKSDAEFNLAPNQLFGSLKKGLQQGCSLGDIVPALYKLSKYKVRIIRPYRGAQVFEELRKATENHVFTPQVLTLPLGDKKMRKVRSAYAFNLLGCIGYDITNPVGFDSMDEAITEIDNGQPDIVVLCSSDEEYEKLAPELCDRLNKLEQQPITVVAGYPKESIDEYRKAGIDAFIHSKCNVLQILQYFQNKLGIIQI